MIRWEKQLWTSDSLHKSKTVKNLYFLLFKKNPAQGSGPGGPTCQQDFRAVDLSKMRSGRPPALYTCIKCIYMCTRQFQPPGWGHHPASRVAPPSTLDVYMYIGPHFWQVDGPEVLLIDPGLTFCPWTASRPHVATIFYPPFSTTHFYLLITWLIHTHIPEWLIPNLDKTQNVILE